jgi:hypothetical protein
LKTAIQTYNKIPIKGFSLLILMLFFCFESYGLPNDIGNLLLQPGGYYVASEIKCCKKSARTAYYDSTINDAVDISDKNQKNYHDCLMQGEIEKHVQMQGLFYACLADTAFGPGSSQISLSRHIFKKEFTFEDVFLASKLADEGKIFLPGASPGFGSIKEEQYIALLAPTKINVTAAEREIGFNLSGLCFFDVPKTRCLLGAVGIYIPIIYRWHYLDFDFLNGSLFSQRTLGQAGSLSIENTLTQFFSDFSSVEDFFVRAIIQPKGLEIKPLHSRFGIGDVSILGLFDFANYWRYADAIQCGLNILFPTGNKQNGKIVWPIELGHGGSFQFEPFFNGYFETCFSFVNPTIFASARFSISHTVIRRVPQLKNQKSQVLLPNQFQQYLLHPFSELDSNVIDFADQAVHVHAHEGPMFLMRFGNIFYNIFYTRFKLGVYYDFYAQEKDIFFIKNRDNFFDTSLLEKDTHRISHSILWNISYKYKEEVELYMGSQHVFTGKNVAQNYQIFASMSLYF